MRTTGASTRGVEWGRRRRLVVAVAVAVAAMLGAGAVAAGSQPSSVTWSAPVTADSVTWS